MDRHNFLSNTEAVQQSISIQQANQSNDGEVEENQIVPTYDGACNNSAANIARISADVTPADEAELLLYYNDEQPFATGKYSPGEEILSKKDRCVHKATILECIKKNDNTFNYLIKFDEDGDEIEVRESDICNLEDLEKGLKTKDIQLIRNSQPTTIHFRLNPNNSRRQRNVTLTVQPQTHRLLLIHFAEANKNMNKSSFYVFIRLLSKFHINLEKLNESGFFELMKMTLRIAIRVKPAKFENDLSRLCLGDNTEFDKMIQDDLDKERPNFNDANSICRFAERITSIIVRLSDNGIIKGSGVERILSATSASSNCNNSMIVKAKNGTSTNVAVASNATNAGSTNHAAPSIQLRQDEPDYEQRYNMLEKKRCEKDEAAIAATLELKHAKANVLQHQKVIEREQKQMMDMKITFESEQSEDLGEIVKIKDDNERIQSKILRQRMLLGKYENLLVENKTNLEKKMKERKDREATYSKKIKKKQLRIRDAELKKKAEAKRAEEAAKRLKTSIQQKEKTVEQLEYLRRLKDEKRKINDSEKKLQRQKRKFDQLKESYEAIAGHPRRKMQKSNNDVIDLTGE
eukprot:g8050.t1